MKYAYEIIFPNGKRNQGELFANNLREARNKLKKEHCFIITLKAVKEIKVFRNSSDNNLLTLALFSYKLAIFWQAGIPLLRSLQIISENICKKWQLPLLDVMNALQNGFSLAVALRSRKDIFNDFYVEMIEVAEQVGMVDKILLNLASYYMNFYKIQNRIKKAVIYPTLVISAVFSLLVFFIAVLVPMFVSLYETLNIKVNAVLECCLLLRQHVDILLGGIGLLVLVLLLVVSKESLRNRLRAYLHESLANYKIAWRLQELQFCQIFSLGIQSGVDLLQALNLTRKILASEKIKAQLQRVIEELSCGDTLANALGKHTLFISKSTLEMLAIGEETGKIEKMLALASKQLEYNLELDLNKLDIYLQPICLIIVAVLLAVVLVILLQPLLGILEGLDATI